ncbi:MAG TPA: YqzL family protein [Bacillales bacterium]|nr:YqzL family protein [Bacillales bacterium]
MLDFTWKFFCMTGNVDTYLLLKEMEKGNTGENEGTSTEIDADFELISEYHQPNGLDQ